MLEVTDGSIHLVGGMVNSLKLVKVSLKWALSFLKRIISRGSHIFGLLANRGTTKSPHLGQIRVFLMSLEGVDNPTDGRPWDCPFQAAGARECW